MELTVGIDLGGTKTAAGVVDRSGRVLQRLQVDTPAAAGPAAVLDAVVQLGGELQRSIAASWPDAALLGVGIGAAGVIDPGTRTVLSATDALPGWAGTRIGDIVQARLGIPVATVNDVHAHAMGEAVHGAGRGHRTVLMIAAGTGVGGALVLDGQVHSGARGVSGHYGHIAAVEAQGRPCSCGRIGHVEAISSGPALCALYNERAESPVGSGFELFKRADAGELLAAECIELSARALGRAIGGLLNSVDPDIVVVGGGLASAGERWWAPLRAGVLAEAMTVVADTPIVPTRLGADSAIIGAAALINAAKGTAA